MDNGRWNCVVQHVTKNCGVPPSLTGREADGPSWNHSSNHISTALAIRATTVMLLSPARVHQDLSACLASGSSSSNGAASLTGAHTALLITPQGQVMCWASNLHSANEDEGEQDEMNGGDEAGIEVGDAEDADGEEPWLEDPERMRLLSGLASQWEEDASPRVECEVSPSLQAAWHGLNKQLGRLLLRQIPLAKPETPPPNALTPTLRSVLPQSFILVLNGSNTTPWSSLTSAVSPHILLATGYKLMG